jgi:hypothetical protein
MDTRNSTSKSGDGSRNPDKARRSFMWKAGAGFSALLAATVPGIAVAGTNNDRNLKARIERLSGQVGILEDEKNIRRLYQIYENLLDRGMYEKVVDLFSDDSEVAFNGGFFKGRKNGVNRLYCNHFRSGSTGKKIDYIPGIMPDIGEQLDMVEVMPDRKSARARFTYSIQVGAPVASDSVLVDMARLQGGGIMKWWEGGTCDIFFVKKLKNGAWKIKRLEYLTMSKASYKPGRSCAGPISTPHFTKVYPEDPAGPDKLILPTQEGNKV